LTAAASIPYLVFRSCPRVRVPCRRASSCRASPHPPSSCPRGELWLHEIKHDGFRVIARKDGKRVKLYSRPGNDLTCRSEAALTATSWPARGFSYRDN
jgi:ATP-dependent DNA ligase